MKFSAVEIRNYYGNTLSGTLTVNTERSDEKSNILVISLSDMQCKILLDAIEPTILRIVKDEVTAACKESMSFRNLLPAPVESKE